MVMILDHRLSDRTLIECRFRDFGILKKCLSCPRFNECPTPQYNAPGLTKFDCRDAKKGGKHE